MSTDKFDEIIKNKITNRNNFNEWFNKMFNKFNIKDENDEHILSKFYNDQEKYSFTFQMMAYISTYRKIFHPHTYIPDA